MSGLFGIISNNEIEKEHLSVLAMHSRQRGSASSSIINHCDIAYKITRADYDINRLIKKDKWHTSSIVMGHSSHISKIEQPFIHEEMFLLHDSLIVNGKKIWKSLNVEQNEKADIEAIITIAVKFIQEGGDLKKLPERILSICEGIISAALVIPNLGKMFLFSNTGSLYVGENEDTIYFASERYPLEKITCNNITQVRQEGLLIDIPKSKTLEIVDEKREKKNKVVPMFNSVANEETLLQYSQPNLKRCKKCILPETMPFIKFDPNGICNYCHNYELRNVPKPKEELFDLVKPYRRKNKPDCIVPFSGGRDSCYGLHLIVNELEMTPITYTYDWGMVTDLGHRNISRMCSRLGVENIVVSADISKKRRNIEKNLRAWLKSPNLGMISILTAGDKHFFKYVETIKKQIGIDLNLWGVNPLEVTHFKAGFLGVKPNFEEKKVYSSGISKQLNYQRLRFKAMTESPGYFNSSLWDTLSGEYHRSFTEKKDYYHIFDYWLWDEKVIDETLNLYDWELAPDTNTTWRIGDGTAALYNYIYYTVAGFTEHDTFRSNQIREGQLTREKALELVKDENRPRYQNISWYLDILKMDFSEVISVINAIPKLYKAY